MGVGKQNYSCLEIIPIPWKAPSKTKEKWWKIFTSTTELLLAEIWRKYFGLWGTWRLYLTFKRLEGRALAETTAEPHYKRIKVDVDPSFFETIEDWKTSLRATLIHELMHVVTWKYTSLVKAFAPERNDDVLQELEEELIELMVEQMNAFQEPDDVVDINPPS